MKHKIIPTIVCLLLCMALMPAAAFADSAKTTPAAPPGIWTDYAATDFAGGSGTAEDPYQIATPEQLAKLAKDINAGKFNEVYNGEHFKLMTDIDLSAHRWIPIGRGMKSLSRTVFTGYFDGNEKVITGMYVDESETYSSAGLFGCVIGSKIKDLTIEDAYVKTVSNLGCREGAGILIGAAQSGSGIYPNIKNCFVSGIVESSDATTGGLVGNSSDGTYEDCTADVEIRGVYSAGGFVGEDCIGIYRNCTAKGDVSGTSSVGGFAGHMERSNIDHCFAQGKVTASGTGAGGFAGYLEHSIVINDCIATGDVESTFQGADTNVGGFAGKVDGRMGDVAVSNSHAAGKVTSTKAGYKPGGFTGASIFCGYTSCSYDGEKNEGLQAIGVTEDPEISGVEGVSTQAVKDNICKDYYGKHIVKEVAEKPASCTVGGHEAYWQCENCGQLFADEKGTQQIEKPAVIPATEHKLTVIAEKPASCTADGHEAYWQCENCGRLFADEKGTQQIEKPAVILATGHKLGDWKVIKKAEAGIEGSRERACVNCDYTESEIIPALEAKDPAKTGDDSNPALYGFLALLAACGAAGALWRRRKA